LVIALTVAILTLGVVACGKGGLTLGPADEQANNHMVSALDYYGGFTLWVNGLSEQERPTSGEWFESLKLLERAIEEADMVRADFMVRAHPDLPDMWQGFLIPSMEKMYG
jgi:hypothetical protein